MKQLPSHVCLFCSHDDTGYLIEYILKLEQSKEGPSSGRSSGRNVERLFLSLSGS